jgi:hypothetical protein
MVRGGGGGGLLLLEALEDWERRHVVVVFSVLICYVVLCYVCVNVKFGLCQEKK